jgi:O-antigen ligase
MALKFGLAALMLYVSLLPFQPFFPPITSGIVAFWLVFVLSFRKSRLSGLRNPLLIASAALYLWLVFGSFYSPNNHEAGLDLTLKITLLLWPLGAATWPYLFNHNKKVVLSLFAYLAALSVLALVVVGFISWQQSGLPLSKFYKFTSTWDWIPNHYIALYASFAVLILLELGILKVIRWRYVIPGLSVLIASMAFTSVRIQIIALPLAAMAFFATTKHQLTNKKRILRVSALGLILFLGVVFAFPSSRNRLIETVDELRSVTKMVNNKQTNHRVYLWQYGWEVAQQNLILGTGTGAGDDALNEALKSCTAEFWNGHGTYLLSDKRYNYHNTFLQHFATNGLVGLLLLIGLFVAPIIIYKKRLGGLQTGFLVLCVISFFTESMLERQAGVLFFSFFYALLFVAPWAETSSIVEKKTA